MNIYPVNSQLSITTSNIYFCVYTNTFSSFITFKSVEVNYISNIIAYIQHMVIQSLSVSQFS
uniref:Uncharacterized protein n=1 Tax=Anguilla anguilla TaxID=7936 RepID=A0A0E9RAT0_ANGAN